MSFFKKIFKGVGKVFKKIGKGITSAFKKFGKFMDKAGILGQAAMFFILPGIGQALSSAFTGLIGTAATATTAGTGLLAGGPISQAAGKALQFVGKVASAPGKVFSSITEGVTSTLKEFSKTALSKLAPDSALAQGAAESFFFGPDSAISRVGTAIKSPFNEKALLEAATQTADEAMISTVDASDVVQTATEKATTANPLNPLPSIDQELMSPSPTLPDMDFLAQQRENFGEKTIRDVTTIAQDKLEGLTDSSRVGKSAVRTFMRAQEEEELAARQEALLRGDVLDTGIYQDTTPFMAAPLEPMISTRIQTLQPTGAYTKPTSIWAQGILQNPLDLLYLK